MKKALLILVSLVGLLGALALALLITSRPMAPASATAWPTSFEVAYGNMHRLDGCLFPGPDVVAHHRIGGQTIKQPLLYLGKELEERTHIDLEVIASPPSHDFPWLAFGLNWGSEEGAVGVTNLDTHDLRWIVIRCGTVTNLDWKPVAGGYQVVIHQREWNNKVFEELIPAARGRTGTGQMVSDQPGFMTATSNHFIAARAQQFFEEVAAGAPKALFGGFGLHTVEPIRRPLVLDVRQRMAYFNGGSYLVPVFAVTVVTDALANPPTIHTFHYEPNLDEFSLVEEDGSY